MKEPRRREDSSLPRKGGPGVLLLRGPTCRPARDSSYSSPQGPSTQRWTQGEGCHFECYTTLLAFQVILSQRFRRDTRPTAPCPPVANSPPLEALKTFWFTHHVRGMHLQLCANHSVTWKGLQALDKADRRCHTPRTLMDAWVSAPWAGGVSGMWLRTLPVTLRSGRK